MREWGGGVSVPRHHELQLQHQLTVGDGNEPYAWGVIAVWVCGEQKYFERTRNHEVSADLIGRCLTMMQDVASKREPDPFGDAVELPVLQKLFPPVEGKELDMRGHEHGNAIAQMAADYKSWKAQENFFSKAADDARTKLLTIAKDNETVWLPGAKLKLTTQHMKEHMRKASSHTKLTVTIEESDDEATPE
jgi:hypothetical protein